MKKVLCLLALAVTLLARAPTARADFIYTFASITPIDPSFGQLNGSFTVPDAAISDGLITTSEITTYFFADSVATFAPPSTTFTAAIPVDPFTGVMLPTDPNSAEMVIIESAPHQFLGFSTGPGEPYFRTNDPDAEELIPGPGTWSVASTSAVPEPASVALVLAGVAGLSGYGWRRRQRAVATAAGGFSLTAT